MQARTLLAALVLPAALAACTPEPLPPSERTGEARAGFTRLVTGPARLTASREAAFTLACADGEEGCRFECALDTQAWETCPASPAYSGLADGAHVLRARATDAAGRTDTRPAEWRWEVDGTAPDTAYTLSGEVALVPTCAPEASCRFECSLDGAPFAPCAAPVALSSAGDGTHLLAVRAVDAAGNTDASPATHAWVYGAGAVRLHLSAAPPTPTSSASARFAFTCAGATGCAGATCHLDGTATPCTSPARYEALADGPHAWSVTLPDGTQLAHTWTVDTQPPETMELARVLSAGGATAHLAFQCGEAGCGFRCALDGAPLGACASPLTLTGLRPGPHTLAVQAVDAAGNADPSPALTSWTTEPAAHGPDATPYAYVTRGPPALTAAEEVELAFGCSAGGSCVTECSLDGAPFSPCQGTQRVKAPAEGAHTFAVRARAGQAVQLVPATWAWRRDITGPAVQLREVPPGPTSSRSARLETACAELDCRLECSLDGAAFTGCHATTSFTGLARGTHRVAVRGVDAAGNAGPPLESSWEVVATLASVYPPDGMQDIFPGSPIIVSFTEPVDATSATAGLALRTAAGAAVAASITVTPDGRTAVVHPARPLADGTGYRLEATGLRTPDGAALRLPGNGVLSRFTTEPTRVRAGDGLGVRWLTPDPATGPVFDTATFHVGLSEPLDEASAAAPGSVRLVRLPEGGAEEEVPVRVHALGARLAVNPAGPLQGGVRHRLLLTSNLRGRNGEPLTPHATEFIPRSTGAGLGELQARFEPSTPTTPPEELPALPLSGLQVNTLRVSSALLGENLLRFSGGLRTRVGAPGQATDALPVTIPSGQRFYLTPLDVRLGGGVPAGVNSGRILMDVVTDGTGVVRANPLRALDASAPDLVTLSMDIALTAEEPRASAIISQDLLNVQLVGTASGSGPTLTLDLVGTKELELLGAEKALMIISLRMRAPGSTPLDPPDSTPPAVLSAVPGDGEERVDVNGPLSVVFTEPLDPASLVDGAGVPRVRLLAGAHPVPARARLAGSTVVLEPLAPLAPGTPHTLEVRPGVRDVSGNAMAQGSRLAFTTVALTSTGAQAPLLASLSVGVPCVLRDATAGNLGRCSRDDIDDAGAPMRFAGFTLAADRPVVARFTRALESSSVTAASFQVTDAQGAAVPGSRLVRGAEVVFIPNVPWTPGGTYTLRLVGGTNGTCDAGELCSRADASGPALPLNPDVMDDEQEAAGAGEASRAAVVVPFTAVPPATSRGLTLVLTPAADSNGSGAREASAEPPAPENSLKLTSSFGSVSDKVYLSGALDTEVQQLTSAGVPFVMSAGNWLLGTSVTASGFETRRMVVRPTGAATGLIRTPAPGDVDRRAVVEVALPVWVHVVDDFLQAAVRASERSTRPLTLWLAGRLEFRADGRLQVTLVNTKPLQVEAGFPFASVTLTAQPGELQVRLVSPQQPRQ